METSLLLQLALLGLDPVPQQPQFFSLDVKSPTFQLGEKLVQRVAEAKIDASEDFAQSYHFLPVIIIWKCRQVFLKN
jgi:hypothetical protein